MALAAVATVAGVIGALIGAGADNEAGQGETIAESSACPAALAADRRRLVGQMLVVRMESVATPALRRGARRGELGGVVLFPDPQTSPSALAAEITRLRRVAERAGSAQPLVMIDQEGGEVKRLADAPPDLPPAAIAARGPETALGQGEATGRALAALGVDVDLAPVLDLGRGGAFISSRSFGAEPQQVGRLGSAFADGLRAAGVAATAKHFPGLGYAIANTDTEPSVVTADRRRLLADLVPFDAAIEAEIELVMVANAVYPALDRDRPAALSKPIVDGLLRRRLGFEGVVITDDLGAGALTAAGIDEGEAAVAAASAGADLLLFALSDGRAARRALLARLRDGTLERERLVGSCARVTALRERLGR